MSENGKGIGKSTAQGSSNSKTEVMFNSYINQKKEKKNPYSNDFTLEVTTLQ